MSASKTKPLEIHNDTALFREALRFTAVETGFVPRLIEKDYFCTLVLQYLCASDRTLTFKGGTCLAKVHSGFYRLSEDLDFSISVPTESARSARSRAADAFKAAVTTIPAKMHPFTLVEAVSGAPSDNNCGCGRPYTSSRSNSRPRDCPIRTVALYFADRGYGREVSSRAESAGGCHSGFLRY
jgi:Nucleotidyl transferase AbiEii toxin, Type IV TA system